MWVDCEGRDEFTRLVLQILDYALNEAAVEQQKQVEVRYNAQGEVIEVKETLQMDVTDYLVKPSEKTHPRRPNDAVTPQERPLRPSSPKIYQPRIEQSRGILNFELQRRALVPRPRALP